MSGTGGIKGLIDFDVTRPMPLHPLQVPALPPCLPGRHWASQLIGKPWEPGAAGPDAYDCWGLVCAVMACRVGLPMPSLEWPVSGGDESTARQAMQQARADGWDRLHDGAAPALWDILFCRQPSGGRHVGVLIAVNGGLHVLHAGGGPSRVRPGAGFARWGAVRLDSIDDLRADGVHTISLWRHPRAVCPP